jgi:hypothetical protein
MTKLIQEQIAKPSKHFFWILASISVIMVSIYFYSIIEITINVKENTVLGEKMSNLSLEVNTLEHQYLQSKNSITLETAKNIGFSDNTNQIFVSRTKDIPSLSLNINEI